MVNNPNFNAYAERWVKSVKASCFREIQMNDAVKGVAGGLLFYTVTSLATGNSMAAGRTGPNSATTNGIAVSGGSGDIDTEIDREWDDTWYARIGFAHDLSDQSVYTLGVSYDSSPVDDKHRTFHLPVEEYYKLSAAYAWTGKNKLNYALGATLMMIGDAEIDQTSQGVRAAGKFDQNYILFAGGTVRYAF